MNTSEIRNELTVLGYQEKTEIFTARGTESLIDSGYAENFGLQWNLFAETQLDSKNGTNCSAERLFNCTGWNPLDLQGKTVLELGSGAGRFTEILLKHGAIVVSVEMSSAIITNRNSNKSENLILIKESILDLDLRGIPFDYVFCFGVAQHTPNPRRVYEVASMHMTSGSKLSIDHYWKRLGPYIPCFLYYPKYLWRPLTKRLNIHTLLKLVKAMTNLALPIDINLRKYTGKLYRLFRLFLPVPLANYYGKPNICKQDWKTLYEYSVMDTYDQLGAAYDQPWTKKQLERTASRLGFKSWAVETHTNNGNGLVLNATK